MRRIAHLSDLHFGAEEARIAEGLLDDLASRSPDLVVVSGDLTQRARRHQFLAARAFLDRIAAPRLVVPGNHDIPLYNVLDRLTRPLSRFRALITDDLHPFHHDSEIAVAGVNSARPDRWKEGRLSLRQIRRLQEQFESVSSDHFKVLVCHHPFIPPEGRAPAAIVGRGRLALRMLETAGCALILTGHLHHAYSGDARPFHLEMKRSILVAQAGTAISHRRREEANAYNQLTLDGDRLDLMVRAWDGRQFATTGHKQFRRTESGWTPASS
ncbi:MAG: metallophosphoesterase [Planctomycetaceae bacterium]|nr:metallophosphoesterase [Planctomycetaceae bacterium]